MMAVSLWYCFYVLIFCTGNRLAYDFIAYMGFLQIFSKFYCIIVNDVRQNSHKN